MKQRVTIQDIADALGISRKTVSKAINNSEGIAEATRDRILQKAIEMGYKQFSYVQSLTEPHLAQQHEPPRGGGGQDDLFVGQQIHEFILSLQQPVAQGELAAQIGGQIEGAADQHHVAVRAHGGGEGGAAVFDEQGFLAK